LIIHNTIDNLNFTKPVVTVGIFDGVHKGHQMILQQITELAHQTGGESVIVSFAPHPRFVLQGDDIDLKLLTSPGEKAQLLNQLGIDHLVMILFTKELSMEPAFQFIKNYLVEKVGISQFVVGYNHHFGHDRLNDFQKLKEYARQFGFGIERAEAQLVNGERVSSSKVREALEKGKLQLANDYLGHSYFLNGTVVTGAKLGRTIGFPTANIQPEDVKKLLPKDGVYAVKIVLENKIYNGMLNIGFRPTVDKTGKFRSIEVNIFDFEEDIYNKPITICFEHWLRDEVKFDGIEMLVKQLNTDKENALKVLSANQ
jgi:riboflavin kinase / FMN adenylyltransferase